jgi:hypothetical protein
MHYFLYIGACGRHCGLRGFVNRLQTLSLALFSLVVHLYPLVVSLFIISRVVAAYCSLDD